MRSRVWPATGVVVVLLAALAAVPAQADSFFNIGVMISFDPPAGSLFAGGTLGGAVQLYRNPGPIQAPVALGEPFVFSGLETGAATLLTGTRKDPGPVQSFFDVFLSLDGMVSKQPGPIQFPAFAFPGGTTEVGSQPAGPIQIPLGMLGDAATSLDASGPLFAFASLGTPVGTWRAHVEVVPEPASVLLLGSGLAGLVGWRRKKLAR